MSFKSLCSLSDDFYFQLALFLNPTDIQALHWSGCTLLWSKIQKATRTFSFELPVLPYTPKTFLPIFRPFSLIQQLPRLTHLALYGSNVKMRHSCPDDLRALPPTLVSFELEVLAFSSPQTLEDIPSAGMMFVDEVFFLKFALNIPWNTQCPRLETFRLFYHCTPPSAGSRRYAAHTEELILSLPRTITTLSLIHPTVDAPFVLPFLSFSQKQSVGQLPPNDASHTLQSPSQPATPIFPNLLHLELLSSDQYVPPLSDVPSTLKLLRITEQCHMTPLVLPNTLAPGLQVLEVTGLNVLDPDWVVPIPDNLESLILTSRGDPTLSESLRLLLPKTSKLKKLGLSHGLIMGLDAIAAKLPSTLTDLTFWTLTKPDQEIEALPPSLTSLYLGQLVCSLKVLSRLPPSLKNFKLSGFEPRESKILPTDLLALPPLIQVFIIEFCPVWPIEALTQLPTTLKYFYVPNVHVSSLFVQNLPEAQPQRSLKPSSGPLGIVKRLFGVKAAQNQPSLSSRVQAHILPDSCIFEVMLNFEQDDNLVPSFLRARKPGSFL